MPDFTPALPPAVQKQVAAANEAIERLKQGTPPAQPVVQTPAPADGQNAPAAPVAQAPAAPVAQAPAAPVAPTAEPSPPAQDAAYWENRFRVVEGKYRAEVPRLQQQLKDTAAQIEALNAQITQLKQAPAAPKITPEDVDAYGPDLLDVIGRRAAEMYEPRMDELRNEIAQLKNQLTQVATTTEQEVHATQRRQTIDALHKAVPEYKDINRDPRFIQWLDHVDEFSGVTRGAMLAQAVEQNDSPRVIAFFNSFKQESARAIAAAGSPPPGGTPRHSLTEMVSPSGAAGSATVQGAGAQTAKRVWTPETVARFYADVQKGYFRGREADKVAIEREIVAAFSGRRAVS